jgi:hypothetical protein
MIKNPLKNDNNTIIEVHPGNKFPTYKALKIKNTPERKLINDMIKPTIVKIFNG